MAVREDRRLVAQGALPLLAATVLAFAVAPLPPGEESNAELAAAALLAVVAIGTAAVAGRRRSESLTVAAAIAYLLVVAYLRDSQGGAVSGYAALVAVPVIWVALNASRRSLWVTIAAVTVTLAAPILFIGPPDYPSSEWRRAILWTAVAAFIGLAVQQLLGQLRHLADHDPLTGLFNRRRFDEEFGRVLAESRRHGWSGALMVVDLDHFKRVNDTRGHAAGDMVLIKVGQALRGRARSTDLLGRLGGDEFVVVFSDVDRENAEAVARELVERMRGAADGGSGDDPRVTISAGLTTFGPATVATTDELLVQADLALYEAKAAGRDGYAFFEDDMAEAAAPAPARSAL